MIGPVSIRRTKEREGQKVAGDGECREKAAEQSLIDGRG